MNDSASNAAGDPPQNPRGAYDIVLPKFNLPNEPAHYRLSAAHVAGSPHHGAAVPIVGDLSLLVKYRMTVTDRGLE
jgi:hypothetical protein